MLQLFSDLHGKLETLIFPKHDSRGDKQWQQQKASHHTTDTLWLIQLSPSSVVAVVGRNAPSTQDVQNWQLLRRWGTPGWQCLPDHPLKTAGQPQGWLQVRSQTNHLRQHKLTQACPIP